MLVHEIRNRTTAFGSFLELVKDRFGPFREKYIEEESRCADNAVSALERLADTFAPLASRNFRRRRRQSGLEDQIRDCLTLHRDEIERKHVQCCVPDSETMVAVDPGELDAIILNLVTNAVYWMGDVPREDRKLEFLLTPTSNGERVRVFVHDTGPGISQEDMEKVFWPGVTRKPGGIGMGLTVASELVAAYGGRMLTEYPGTRGGASFAFDLPLRKKPLSVSEGYVLKLLFIEDEPDAVKPVQNLIKREKVDMQFEVSGFEVAEDKIASFRPDIVILDLLVGGASKEPEPGGLNTRDFIWNKHFCPIVVYSAQPNIHDETYESHPFVKSVQKGSGSPSESIEGTGRTATPDRRAE